ncbi:MAG: hypothetical protein ABEH64_05270 [Salinirussus sp.]
MRAVAVNVGANTNEPGFRGPIHPDRRFTFLPIPESAPTAVSVPTYGDLDDRLPVDIPPAVHDRRVHLDPEFPDYPHGRAYTYGDEHGVKARPLSALSTGDRVYFYATLSVQQPTPTLPPDWGAFLIAHFELVCEPISDFDAAPAADQDRVATNAHRKRDPPDAEVLLAGAHDSSALYDRAIPLSSPVDGTDPGPIVTALSTDSGAGPWWRRPLQFDPGGASSLARRVRARRYQA